MDMFRKFEPEFWDTDEHNIWITIKRDPEYNDWYLIADFGNPLQSGRSYRVWENISSENGVRVVLVIATGQGDT